MDVLDFDLSLCKKWDEWINGIQACGLKNRQAKRRDKLNKFAKAADLGKRLISSFFSLVCYDLIYCDIIQSNIIQPHLFIDTTASFGLQFVISTVNQSINLPSCQPTNSKTMDLSTPSPPTTDPTTPPPTPEELLESQMKAWRKAHHEALVLDSRMSIPYGARLPLCTSISFLCGMALGISHGSQAASLRFRAENAHRLPTSPTGWYLYHKSKNYNTGLGGVKEGLRMGGRIAFWTAGLLAIEDMCDRWRGKKDVVNTVVASLSVAGGFSLWSEFIFISFCLFLVLVFVLALVSGVVLVILIVCGGVVISI